MIAFSITVVVLIAAGFAWAFPDYEVEFSTATGRCKNVKYQGKIDPQGCQKVANGQITRYESFKGK